MSEAVPAALVEADQNPLRAHYKKCIQQFLRTVVVVDDRAYRPESPQEATIIEALPVNPLGELAFGDTSSAGVDEVPVEEEPVEDEAHELDGPGLVRLFAQKGVVCSIIQPPSNQETQALVDEIETIAQVADVLVLDWELRPGDHTASLEAILQIIDNDFASGGRLRFIVVYTAARQRIVKNTIKAALKERFNPDAVKLDGHLIKIEHACVVVLNKPSHANSGAVPLDELPDAILEHHASFSSGLLPAAAISAIGTLRGHTHQILGQFHEGLDAAFIAHRALIPKPDDAEMHLLELVADSLYHLMLSEGVRDHLSDQLCIARLETLQDKHGFSEEQMHLVAQCVSAYGSDKVGVIREMLGLGIEEKNPERRFIARLYGHVGEAESRRKEMAFLHDFTRTHLHKRTDDNPPRLTMGTVVAFCRGESFDYQMCIQPRCDSVRIDRPRSFPFISLENSDQPNVHLSWAGSYKSLSSSEKLFDIRINVFGGGASVPAIYAQLDAQVGKWYFEDSAGSRFYWVGDLRKDKAQRLASKIASRLHMPGINEYEPTRRPD
ncbi:response regulator receiver domain [Pseudomonas sp. D(2018)]|uniref:response regulator receiver domain n=1 Tax=Pseudomonas sp. D(2018) TaxID=2502238 RepID=UPI0010F90888|nr:response regulator receiver domain [Pseudomonas sp. D(2018)]